MRRRLLETAAAHFAERGLEGAQIDAIAVAAGFATGTVYNYFPSKEDLFAEMLTARESIAALAECCHSRPPSRRVA